jgi:hypothetical protein
MTDKQITIDECNVSECKYFNGYQRIVRNNECIVDMQNACIEEIETKPCSQKHNCYFKNWQRKEQECEYWKHQAELGVDTTNRLTKELKEKEQECDELKEILNEGCLHNLTLMTEQRVLLQTLAEIKKLVEKAREDLYTCESIGYADDDLRAILQKINEVEDE